MGSERDLGQALGQLASNQDSMSINMVKHGSITTYFVLNNYGLNITFNRMFLERRTMGTAFMVGHPTNSTVGSTYTVGEGAMGSWSTLINDTAEYQITNEGKTEIAKWLNDESSNYPIYIAVGTGSSAYSESGTSIIQAGDRYICANATNGTAGLTLVALPFGISTTLREVGLFNTSTNGEMFARNTFSATSTATTYQYRVTYTINIADSTSGDALVTWNGLSNVRDWLIDGSGVAPNYVEWASGTAQPNYWDTSLSGLKERIIIGGQTRSPSPIRIKYTTLLDKNQMSGTAIVKSGLFETSSGNDLWAVSKYGAINKTTLFKINEVDNISIR
jgi:hypothetical protein